MFCVSFRYTFHQKVPEHSNMKNLFISLIASSRAVQVDKTDATQSSSSVTDTDDKLQASIFESARSLEQTKHDVQQGVSKLIDIYHKN